MAKSSKAAPRVSDLLRVPSGPVDLSALDTRATPGFDGGKAAGRAALAALGPRLSDLQERLHASGLNGSTRRLLLILQGMDTSGKGGVVRHVVGQVDPQGCEITAFKAPTREELAHDFLWRIRRRLPGPGKLGVFDRSHYEDVLAVRVHNVVPRQTWSRRYAAINRFEAGLVTDDIHVVKVFLHISKEEQRQRLLARLDNPAKHWKFNPATSTSGPSGPTTRRRTRPPWSAATATSPPGTGSRPTASGTATGRWPACSWSTWRT